MPPPHAWSSTTRTSRSQNMSVSALARIANDAIADLDRSEDPRLAQQHLQRADELLKQFLCEDHAYRSRLTLLGYEQRLSRFGNQIM